MEKRMGALGRNVGNQRSALATFITCVPRQMPNNGKSLPLPDGSARFRFHLVPNWGRICFRGVDRQTVDRHIFSADEQQPVKHLKNQRYVPEGEFDGNQKGIPPWLRIARV